MLILATQSLRSGEKALTLSLLDRLVHSEDKKIREEATLLEYELEKEEYFYLKDTEAKKKKREKLRKLFLLIYKEKMYDAKEVDKWYKEALFAGVDRAVFYFLEKKIVQEKKNVQLLESAYYYARKLHYRTKAMYYLRLLQKYDLLHRDKWIDVEYFQYINFKEYAKAEQLLLRYAKKSLPWIERLAEFYLMRKEFTKAAQIYMDIFSEARVYKRKRAYFYKALKALQAGSLFNAATRLAHQYEEFFLDDVDARQFILKIYIAGGKLGYASRLSKKILRREFR